MYDYWVLSLFGLVLNLRHFNLFPGEELPDSSSVVLISQGIQEHIKGGRGFCQNRSHLKNKVGSRTLFSTLSLSWETLLRVVRSHNDDPNLSVTFRCLSFGVSLNACVYILSPFSV